MKQKHFFIIFGVVGFIFLLCWLAVIILVIKNLLGSTAKSNEPAAVVNVTLCDVNADNLCIVNFGANNLNRMIINFQLPRADYPAFYVKAANRGTVSVYSCEVTESIPTSAYCTGVRTPLGETIDIEVYTTDKDQLIARGSFLVSAIALSTPISAPTGPPVKKRRRRFPPSIFFQIKTKRRKRSFQSERQHLRPKSPRPQKPQPSVTPINDVPS